MTMDFPTFIVTLIAIMAGTRWLLRWPLWMVGSVGALLYYFVGPEDFSLILQWIAANPIDFLIAMAVLQLFAVTYRWLDSGLYRHHATTTTTTSAHEQEFEQLLGSVNELDAKVGRVEEAVSTIAQALTVAREQQQVTE